MAIAAAASAVPVGSPILSYATYVGTGLNSTFSALAVDSEGYTYIGGSRPGTEDSSCGFLTKLNPTGTAALWSLCLPPVEIDGIALDRDGYIYVVGSNPPVNFVHRSTVIKLSPDAQRTIYSTEIAGGYAGRIAVDRTGVAYLAGVSDATFKATPGALMTGGGAFALKLNTVGSIDYATYLDLVAVGSIAVDSKGQAWVAGGTCPNGLGSNCSSSRSGSSSAIRKLDASGAHLLVNRSFGGGSIDRFTFQYDSARGVAVDGTDSVWVVGSTESDSVPTTPNALEPKPTTTFPAGNGIGGTGYAVKLSPSGDLLYGTYIGKGVGEGLDRNINSVVIDSENRTYFALNLPGRTFSDPACGSAATLMTLSADGLALLVNTGLLSPVQMIALDGNGGLYVAGNTTNRAFLPTPGAYQDLFPGGSSAGYIARYDLTKAATSQFSCVTNAASLIPGDNPQFPEGAVTPGEIVSLFGDNFPANPSVTFDGRAAPILYAGKNQINAVVPFEVSAPSTVILLEDIRGFVLPVWHAVPALFTANSSGSGQIAAVNQDGTGNSKSNPAKPGSAVSVYLTGAGAMAPPIGNGQTGPLQPPFPVPLLGVSARINGADAPVLFIGQAPGLVAGVVQVNIQIPAATPSGDEALVVYIGDYQTQVAKTTIAVQ